MKSVEIVGASVVAVGLMLIIVGLIAALREARISGTLGDASEFVDSIRKLVRELANGRASLAFFAFGTILVFLGGVILLGGDLTS
ncbi:hypothetical protein [Streptomyces sp. NPDC001851]|uniref:hypothetical protein n=1 Tax=Streptomyces sp. NPDC001851 TaxID=3154529 RepID=UPI003323539B